MIELKNISFTYENNREGDSQLRHVDLQVERGELVILAGRSGCGKTTLTRVPTGCARSFILVNLPAAICWMDRTP